MAQLLSVEPVLMVRDVAASIRFYAKLGFRTLFQDGADTPGYAVIGRESVTLHLQWHAEEDFADGDRPNYRFQVTDIDSLYDEFTAARVVPDGKRIAERPWGTREFEFYDPDRNGLFFVAAHPITAR